MKKIVSSACVVLVLLLGACGGDDDDDASGDESSDSQDEGGNESGGDQRDEYVDAIAASVRGTDSPFADLSDDDAECVGEAYVDAIGLDELEAAVTPAEIRENPDADHSDWGIEMTDEQGVEVFRTLIDCSPAAEEAIAAGIAEGFTEGFTGEAGNEIEVDEDCLAEADADQLEGFMGAAIAQGEDFTPTEEQGAELLDWFDDCVDLRGAFIAAFTSDPTMPEGVGECLEENVDDQLVEDFWSLAFTSGGDDSVLQGSPLMTQLTDLMTTCATQGATTTTAAG